MLVEHMLIQGSGVDAAENAQLALVGLLRGVRAFHMSLQVMLEFIRLPADFTSPGSLV